MIPYKEILSSRDEIESINTSGEFKGSLNLETRTTEFNLLGFNVMLSSDAAQDIASSLEKGLVRITFKNSKGFEIKRYTFTLNTVANPTLILFFHDFETYIFKDVNLVEVYAEYESEETPKLGQVARTSIEMFYTPLKY